MFDTVESILRKESSSPLPRHDNSILLQHYPQHTHVRRTAKIYIIQI